MRVLAAQNRVDADDFALEIEHFKVVRHSEEVHCGRQLHLRMAPVALVEDAELAARDKLLQAVLHVAEVPDGSERMVRRDLLLKIGRFARIRFERAHHVDPVEGRELIEVHEVVVRVERRVDEVADDVGVLRDLDADRVFNGAHGRKRMNARADAADAFNERPCVARIAPLQNDFETAPHRAGAHRVDDFVVFAENGLNAKMAFDSGDRVDDNTTFAHYSLPPISLLVRARDWATAERAACAAAATPTTATVARPTLSTVASMPMPKPGGSTVVSCS